MKGHDTLLLVRLLRLTGAVVFVLALPAVALGAPDGRGAAWAMIAVLVAAPFARVLYLTTSWMRMGDRPFALAGFGLLALIALVAAGTVAAR